jgi:hypothetical protein
MLGFDVNQTKLLFKSSLPSAEAVVKDDSISCFSNDPTRYDHDLSKNGFCQRWFLLKSPCLGVAEPVSSGLRWNSSMQY